MNAREVDATIRRLAAQRVAHAREAIPVIGAVLARAPIRWIEHPERDEKVMKLEVREDSMERLRDLCQLVAGADGHELDDEQVIGLMSLAVVRGEPLWLSLLPPPPSDPPA